MKVDLERPRDHQVLLGVLLLAVGFGIGHFFRLPEPPPDSVADGDAPDAPWLRPAGELPRNGLTTLELELPDASRQALSAARELALQRGMILTEGDGLVPARVRLGGDDDSPWVGAMVRLKGDLLDHLDTDRWSLRVELEGGKLLGMSRFSIQHPKVRGYLLGWLGLAMARREGLLAPRASFVNVVLDGVPNGVYELEEHFSKELLESQGRREGPIVHFAEDAFWSNNLQGRTLEQREGGVTHAGNPVFVAEVSGYGEKKLGRDEKLAAALQRALDQLRELQLLLVAESTRDIFAVRELETALPAFRHHQSAAIKAAALEELRAPVMARLDAILRSRSDSVGELLDLQRCARMGALLSLLNARHGAAWINLRFYHDPVSDRLEPIAFDLGASLSSPGVPEPLVWETSLVGATLGANEDYYLDSFRYLRQFASAEWLAEVERDLGEELALYSAALQADGVLPPGGDAASIWNGLRLNQVGLRQILDLRDPVGFHARLHLVPQDGGVQRGSLAIEAWGMSRVPVVLEGFRYGNGELVSARDALDDESALVARLEDDGVILPWDGRRLRFRFPVDERLASLRAVEAVTDAIQQRTSEDRNVRLQLDAVYRRLGADESVEEPLVLRRTSLDDWQERGRPAAPTLEEALRLYPFLDYDLDAARLFVRPGDWTLDGDLLVPAGHALHAGPGVRLRFPAGAILQSSNALQFQGSASAPVALEAADPDAPWAGVLVIDAPLKSVWSHAEVRGAAELARGGWASSGAVTFYRSAVELRDVAFLDARGEDSVNVFAAPFLLDRCRFDGAFSDAFDGDFVTGLVRDCEFRNAGGDGVDVSGSRVTVERCRFIDIADKALSIGEASEVELLACQVTRCGIGLAVKDSSRVTASDLRVEDARHYGIATYVKKPEHGPCTVTVENAQLLRSGLGEHLVQRGCELTLDGVRAESVEVDVARLYEEGVLGN